jgi:Fe(3+) dicitrate transport protein
VDTITLGRWTLTPGVRYEHIDLEARSYSRTDPDRTGPTTDAITVVNAVVPGVGLTYAVRPGLGVFAGVHRGFAPPGPGAAAGTDVEHSVNYEAGVRIERGAARSEVVLFYNRYGNLLGRDSLATGGSGDGQLFNGGRAAVHGLEASWACDGTDILGAGRALPVRLAYTFTRAEFRSNFRSQFGPWGTVEIGDVLPYVPRHQLFASIAAEHRAWYGRLEAVAVGRMRTVAAQGDYLTAESTEPSFVVNLSGEHALTPDVRLFASLQNVFDRVSIVARHPAGIRPGLPRLFQAGLKFTLGR